MRPVVAFMGATGLALMVSGVLRSRDRRLAVRVDPYVGRRSAGSRPATGRSLRARAGGWLERRSTYRQDGRLVARLRSAGLPDEVAPYLGERLAWAAIAAAAGVLVAAAAVAGGSGPGPALISVSLFAFLGWTARDRFLTAQIHRRGRRLQAELPTAVDLLALSIVAGESVPAALERVASASTGTEIGAEFRAVLHAVRAGAPAVEALEDMRMRLPLPAVARLVDALVTAIEKGAPLGDVLRAQADDVRRQRLRELLEAGGRREILMLVPIVFLMLPTTVLFVVYPGLFSLQLLVP